MVKYIGITGLLCKSLFKLFDKDFLADFLK